MPSAVLQLSRRAGHQDSGTDFKVQPGSVTPQAGTAEAPAAGSAHAESVETSEQKAVTTFAKMSPRPDMNCSQGVSTFAHNCPHL